MHFLHIKPLHSIIDSHSVNRLSYADDVQLQMPVHDIIISELLHNVQSRVSDVKAWATANMPKLTDNKTNVMPVT